MLGLDVYALDPPGSPLGGDRQPGPAVAFGVQNITAVMTLVTLAQAGLVKGIVGVAKAAGADDDAASIPGWVTMGA